MFAIKPEKLSVNVAERRIEIRLFFEKDRSALQEIYLKSRISTFRWLDKSFLKTSDFDRDTDGERILVATIENNPVGFISAWEPENFIHHLFVHPSSIGNGVGSALLLACLKKIGRPASLKCLEKNISAKNFYLSRGWKIISRAEGPDGKYLLMQLDEKLIIENNK